MLLAIPNKNQSQSSTQSDLKGFVSICQAGGGSETIDTSEEEQNSWSASDQEVKDLSEMAVKIEKHYGRPMDWGIFCFCWVSLWYFFILGLVLNLRFAVICVLVVSSDFSLKVIWKTTGSHLPMLKKHISCRPSLHVPTIGLHLLLVGGWILIGSSLALELK